MYFNLITSALYEYKGDIVFYFPSAFVSLGDSAELWVTLNAMGYDYNLVQDEAALFRVTI